MKDTIPRNCERCNKLFTDMDNDSIGTFCIGGCQKIVCDSCMADNWSEVCLDCDVRVKHTRGGYDTGHTGNYKWQFMPDVEFEDTNYANRRTYECGDCAKQFTILAVPILLFCPMCGGILREIIRNENLTNTIQ